MADDVVDAALQAAMAKQAMEMITATIKVLPTGRECSLTFPVDITYEEAFNLLASCGGALTQVFQNRRQQQSRILVPAGSVRPT